jgi:hypothetical protein
LTTAARRWTLGSGSRISDWWHLGATGLAVSMYANAIAQVEPPAVGIHLIWLGPYTRLYSRKGWFIQRREFMRQKETIVCDELDSAAIAKLRVERDCVSPIGIVRLRDGLWPLPIAAAGATAIPCDVFTLQLNGSRKTAQLTFKGRQAFAVALREGKVIAVDGPRSGSATFELRHRYRHRHLLRHQSRLCQFLCRDADRR